MAIYRRSLTYSMRSVLGLNHYSGSPMKLCKYYSACSGQGQSNTCSSDT